MPAMRPVCCAALRSLCPASVLGACLLRTQALDAAVEHFVDMVFLQRLRTPADRHAVAATFNTIWGRALHQRGRPSVALDPATVRVGRAVVPRADNEGALVGVDSAPASGKDLRLQNGSLRALEAVMQV